MLIKFIITKMMGTKTKNKTDVYFIRCASSCRFENKVVEGIKKLFIKSMVSIYRGILNHHKLKTDFSFAVIIEFANMSRCFNCETSGLDICSNFSSKFFCSIINNAKVYIWLHFSRSFSSPLDKRDFNVPSFILSISVISLLLFPSKYRNAITSWYFSGNNFNAFKTERN